MDNKNKNIIKNNFKEPNLTNLTNCKIFFNDLTKCVNEKKNTFGELQQPDNSNDSNNFNNFNFFECNEYKNFINNSRLKIKEIRFNPNEIVHPCNSHYTITNVNGIIKIKFDD